ncbi:MAG: hypothetical protein AB7F31_00815 [Parachlamydiales bacterium]
MENTPTFFNVLNDPFLRHMLKTFTPEHQQALEQMLESTIAQVNETPKEKLDEVVQRVVQQKGK